ncbi:hypothetical protein [Bartonella krasnovii]|uniref:hypothetical protein n=1 Tax=Bartonella krasnovii TaxID=2267275 RepID=UPI001F4C7B24|nr:hypothetical protein [Bartonella krasnovii]UNF49825.1 hypothetical protein MNL03_05865 [Bartonella krasnovii]
MKTIATEQCRALTPTAFKSFIKTVDTTIHTYEERVLSLITLKISKEYAKGNFQHDPRLKRISTTPLSFKEKQYVREKLSL